MAKKVNFFLNRVFQNKNKTLSTGIVFDGQKFVLDFKAIELPWRDNEPFISCIPAGVYPIEAIRRASNRKYAVWVKDVPQRSEILFHTANFVRTLEGCIAPGTKFEDIDRDGIIDVKNSQYVMNRIEEVFPLHSIGILTITNVFMYYIGKQAYKLEAGHEVRKWRGKP